MDAVGHVVCAPHSDATFLRLVGQILIVGVRIAYCFDVYKQQLGFWISFQMSNKNVDLVQTYAINLGNPHPDGKEGVGRGRIGTPCCSSNNVIISRGILPSIIFISNDIEKANILLRLLGSVVVLSNNIASTFVHAVIPPLRRRPSSFFDNDDDIAFWTRFGHTGGGRAGNSRYAPRGVLRPRPVRPLQACEGDR